MRATVESVIDKTPRKRIVVTREKLAAYSSAIRAFKSGRQTNQNMMTPKEWVDYKVELEEVRAKSLGDQYQSGGGWTVTADQASPRPPDFNPIPAPLAVVIRRAKIKSCRKWLNDTFPNCFTGYGQPKRPLKIGIVSDILQRYYMTGDEADLLRETVADYRSSFHYRQTYVIGAERINLNGKVIGIVGEDDKGYLPVHLVKELDARRETA
jgi:hypothetical protein